MPKTSKPETIPARSGKATVLVRGQSVKVINTHGTQVVDTWAFSREDLTEFMSMEHSRATHRHLIPRVGDALLTNRRRPILTLTEDTAGGIHDTLMAACDRYRYQELGHNGYHDNCTDNLAAALAALGLTPPETPSPLNLFMNIPWTMPVDQRHWASTDRGALRGEYLTSAMGVFTVC
jgi:uncharacterized protein YcgI (DUF1989 family)